MDLKTLFDSMSEEQRNIQLGFDTATPLTHAFTSKRAVHAGLSGRPLEKEEAQRVWNELCNSPLRQVKCKQPIFISLSAKRNVHIVDSINMLQIKMQKIDM